MIGKRHDWTDDDTITPGEYGKGPDGRWYAMPPVKNWMLGNLSAHTVVEHADDTITVSPSILISVPNRPEQSWHGYLERGVWREV